MNTQTKEVALKVNELKDKILQSENKLEVIDYLKEIIEIALLTPIKVVGPLTNTGYYKESRKRAIDLLKMDLSAIENGGYYDLETIHFQTAGSILLLLFTILDSNVSKISKIIEGLD